MKILLNMRIVLFSFVFRMTFNFIAIDSHVTRSQKRCNVIQQIFSVANGQKLANLERT